MQMKDRSFSGEQLKEWWKVGNEFDCPFIFYCPSCGIHRLNGTTSTKGIFKIWCASYECYWHKEWNLRLQSVVRLPCIEWECTDCRAGLMYDSHLEEWVCVFC